MLPLNVHRVYGTCDGPAIFTQLAMPVAKHDTPRRRRRQAAVPASMPRPVPEMLTQTAIGAAGGYLAHAYD